MMDEPLMNPAEQGRSYRREVDDLTREDSKEMTELASDTQPEETGKMMMKMDEYDIVTDPTPGRYGKRRLKRKAANVDSKRRAWKTWSSRKVNQTIRGDSVADGINGGGGWKPPITTGYHSLENECTSTTKGIDGSHDHYDDDDIYPDSINYIQQIYARERFGDYRQQRTRVTATTIQQSVATFNSFDVDGEPHTPAPYSPGGIIDGRSSSITEFVPIESMSARDMSTTQALVLCNKYVLKPYNIFLKIIGWRPMFSTTGMGHISRCCKKVFNFMYPCLMIFMLLVTSVAQALTCFSRSQSTLFPLVLSNESHAHIIDCRKNIVSLVILGDVLIIVAYFWGLYSYRYSNPEHLSCLIETVFLSFNTRLVRRSQKKLVIFLLCLLTMGVLWIIFSFAVSIARFCLFHPFNNSTIVYSFQKLVDSDNETTLRDPSPEVLASSITTGVAVIGFIFFDLLYVAVVINYCSQCQLLCHYVTNVTEKIRHKAYALGDAIKEIYRVSEFLQVLNGTVAFITGLVFFVFFQGTITSYMDYLKVESGSLLGIIIGLCNICQWSSASLLPLIMAAKLTGKCKQLKKVCLEVGARPFVYSDTPQLVLDSFLLYTLSTNYRAKLGCVAVHPEYIVFMFFILLLLFTIGTQYAPFEFATWV